MSSNLQTWLASVSRWHLCFRGQWVKGQGHMSQLIMNDFLPITLQWKRHALIFLFTFVSNFIVGSTLLNCIAYYSFHVIKSLKCFSCRNDLITVIKQFYFVCFSIFFWKFDGIIISLGRKYGNNGITFILIPDVVLKLLKLYKIWVRWHELKMLLFYVTIGFYRTLFLPGYWF